MVRLGRVATLHVKGVGHRTLQMSILRSFQRLRAPATLVDFTTRSAVVWRLNLCTAALLRSAAAAQRYEALKRMDYSLRDTSPRSFSSIARGRR